MHLHELPWWHVDAPDKDHWRSPTKQQFYKESTRHPPNMQLLEEFFDLHISEFMFKEYIGKERLTIDRLTAFGSNPQERMYHLRVSIHATEREVQELSFAGVQGVYRVNRYHTELGKQIYSVARKFYKENEKDCASLFKQVHEKHGN
jgi:hypothetical protein